METLVTAVIAILCIAWVIDSVLREQDVRQWRAASLALEAQVSGLSVAGLTVAANERFRGFFDAVYGARFWSFRRFARSCLSSLIALVIIVLVLGWEETIIGLLILVPVGPFAWEIALLVFFANLLGDYLSLQETRWVMARSKGSGAIGIGAWFVFDLVVTTAIFALFFSIWVFVQYGNLPTQEDLKELFREDSIFTAKEGFLPFWLSTYFTSALWIAFVVNALGIRLLSAASPTLSMAFRVIGRAERPAQAAAGFFCGALLLGYAGSALVAAARAWVG